MGEWKQMKLEDLGFLQRGRSRHRPRYAFHLYGGPYPFVQTGDVREAGKYLTKYTQTYTEAGLAQSKLWPKGTICITIAANIAELTILGLDACFPDSVLGFIAKEGVADQDFVYYSLFELQKKLKHIGEGSVQDNINLGTFQEVLVPTPTLTEQRAIGTVLSSLDAKIDLLNRQNKTLEAMAEMLFRQWFVEASEEGWEEFVLTDIASHCKVSVNPGKHPTRTYHHYSLPAYDEGRSPSLELGETIMSSKYVVPENAVLVSKLNPRFPRVWPIRNRKHEHPISSTEFQVFVPKQAEMFGFLYCFLISKPVQDELASVSSGTSGSHQRVSPDDIKGLTFLAKSKQQLVDFSKVVDPMLEKIEANKDQVASLTALRDTLLPKLMSGEVRVEMMTE